MPLNYQNIVEVDTAAGEVRGRSYTPQDLDLMDNVYGYLRNPEFGKSDYDRVKVENHIKNLI